MKWYEFRSHASRLKSCEASPGLKLSCFAQVRELPRACTGAGTQTPGQRLYLAAWPHERLMSQLPGHDVIHLEREASQQLPEAAGSSTTWWCDDDRQKSPSPHHQSTRSVQGEYIHDLRLTSASTERAATAGRSSILWAQIPARARWPSGRLPLAEDGRVRRVQGSAAARAWLYLLASGI
jgi:hypothetical protein